VTVEGSIGHPGCKRHLSPLDQRGRHRNRNANGDIGGSFLGDRRKHKPWIPRTGFPSGVALWEHSGHSPGRCRDSGVSLHREHRNFIRKCYDQRHGKRQPSNRESDLREHYGWYKHKPGADPEHRRNGWANLRQHHRQQPRCTTGGATASRRRAATSTRTSPSGKAWAKQSQRLAESSRRLGPSPSGRACTRAFLSRAEWNNHLSCGPV